MSTKNSLRDLLSHGLMHCGDGVEFTFKGNTFAATIFAGGILASATWKKPNDKTHAPCFMDRAGFDSLTDWCDTCIQELLDEYATRFSGWKRCKHTQTGTPMAMLRDQLKHMKCATVPNLQQMLLAEQKKNIFLLEQIRLLKNNNNAQKTHANGHDDQEDDNPFRLRI